MSRVLFIPFLLAAAGALYAQPNPYREVEGWAKLPAGMQWGQVISVDPLPDGNILAFQRTDPPLLIFDQSGKLVHSFGDGMFIQAHGLTVDKDGFIWASDAAARNGKGEQVFKFTPEGKVVMTLGTAGVAGESETTFNGPSDIAIAPNGDIFVSDGHVNNRVVKFSKDGKFIKAWGKKGSGPGEFNVPHTLAFDSRGRLFVGDRSNSRIQIFDQDGNYLEEWKQFSRPSGIFITPNDIILVADSDSNTATNPGWKRGIRIGSAKDGKVTALIPEVGVDWDSKERWYPGGPVIAVTSAAEGVAMDSHGNIYGAEVGPRALKKYVKK
ncbi:MAG TPA: peptidyl-alpha-hydroxyglycine alpha-amidating lyase family protein [Bryobacteraceae bacterium]|nr:peptidyl-alpha-hydroxyglycine alpha-amidating lyase family protein [Bryobacteraceae bacterium]